MAVLYEILGDIDAVNGPVLHLELSLGELSLHSLGTVLHRKVILVKLGMHLGQVEKSLGIVSLQTGFVQTSP